MERDAKRTKLKCQEPRNPEIDVAKNVNTRRSSFCVATTSCNDSESISTSPILDTTKTRHKGKSWIVRRAVSDSSYLPPLATLGKGRETKHISGTAGNDKNLQLFSKSEDLKRCVSCDSMINADSCQNCSKDKLANQRSDPLDVSLVNRLRDLKRYKKPAVRISDLNEAQITEEKFVESVRLLDKAHGLTPLTQMLQSPKKNLGFVSFDELELLSASELEVQRNSPSVTHLSLDEDKEEDMFADLKDSAEVVEDIEDFSQWKYNPADTSASSFHGFSSHEYNRSRDIAERGSQFRELDEVDGVEKTACFRGFPSSDIDRNRNSLQNWQFLLRNDYPDSKAWEDWSVERPKIENHRNVKDIQQVTDGLSSNKASENIEFSSDNIERLAAPETISKAQVLCPISISSIKKTRSMGFSADCRKRVETRETITKAKVLSPIEMKNNKEESMDDFKSGDSLSSRSYCGFSTAGGRPIRVSEPAINQAKLLFSKEIESMKDDPLNNREFDDVLNSRSKCGFSTANGRPIHVSKTALAKAESRFSEKIENIEDELFDAKVDSDSRSKCGSPSAVGSAISVTETAISKVEALLSKDIETATDNSRHDCKSKDSPEPGSSSKLTDPITYYRRRRPITIPETTVNKAQRLDSELDDCKSRKIAESSPKKETEEMKNECKIDCGFATAGGRELKISKELWLKAKAAYDAIVEPCIADLAHTNTDPERIKFASKHKTETMPSGFSTASGRFINVATKAVSAAEAQLSSDLKNMEFLDLEDFVDPVEKPEISKKRKFEEIDEETPLRRDASLKGKRGRYVNDLQARKLFDEDSDNEDEVETAKRTSEIVGLNRVSPEKNLIFEEVVASAAALLEDEERSNEGMIWQTNSLRTYRSIIPELGCEAGNKSRADGSTMNLLGIFNRGKLEKVNFDGSGSRDLSSSRAASGSSTKTKVNNQRAASAEKREESQEIQPESIPDDLTFDSQFSQDIEHSPVIDKFIAEATKIMKERLAMASKQDEAIRGKKRTKPEPCDGFLYNLRNSNRDSRTSWKQLTDGIAPSPRKISEDSLGRDILSVTANSAAHYSFRCADFYGEMNVRRNIEGIQVGDGAFLILDGKNCVGVREFERAFLASPGVDPYLVPTGWVRNHYRWIVWKLASMDRVHFGPKCLPRMLTPDRVMLELKYRYDREIYRTQWPPLRRILERAENASTRIVLCVSSIIVEEDENAPVKGAYTPNTMGSTAYNMKVTDGWYSIATSIDAAMINLIKSGKVREGTKLMIFGAKAVNLDQGCSALEIPEAVTLRIYSNSARRARWDTKLDYYHTNRGPMSLSLKSIKPNGGAICKLVVAVSRVYPILYREKLPDGQFVFRNARCDEEVARAHEARHHAKMEEIYANAWSEFQIDSMSRKTVGTTRKRSCTQEEAEECERDMAEELRQRISSKISECHLNPRDVTPVMKIRIAEGDTCALVTVWSTDRDTTELFVEGSSIAIYNAFASGVRANELQITASRSTFVKRELSRKICYPERIYTSLTDVTESGFNPVYGEFDTIGIVSSTGPAPHGMKNFETVNLACPRPGDATASDFLSVLFWQGVSAHGYAKILTVGSLVACSNLEWRRNTSRSIPTAYCTERSVFSKNPRQNHLTQAFESLRNEIKEPLGYAAACATVIEEEIAKKSALKTPGAGGTPYKPATSNSRTPGWSPPDLSSIDVNCTTPKIDSKKASTRKRIEQLELYGEPPKLPSIVINNSSRKVLSDFRSPVLTPVSKS